MPENCFTILSWRQIAEGPHSPTYSPIPFNYVSYHPEVTLLALLSVLTKPASLWDWLLQELLSWSVCFYSPKTHEEFTMQTIKSLLQYLEIAPDSTSHPPCPQLLRPWTVLQPLEPSLPLHLDPFLGLLGDSFLSITRDRSLTAKFSERLSLIICPFAFRLYDKKKKKEKRKD